MAQLLVVEDNADILHLIWTQMRARGHQVLGASSGPEALAAVELWGPPQVAVLDVAMPSMDGLELLQQLRATTGMQELPAIFLSARVDRQTVEAAHRLGAAYLAKPFMEEILYAAIEAALTKGYEGLWTAIEAAKHRSLEDTRRSRPWPLLCENKYGRRLASGDAVIVPATLASAVVVYRLLPASYRQFAACSPPAAR